MNYREAISERYLTGLGLEFGALHNPLPVSSQVEVSYADKFAKDKLVKNFKELKSVEDKIVETDVFVDLNSLDYSSLSNNNYDFFIANHVIEHLINPLSFLDNLNSIMKPNSYLYLAIPDKEYTFDCSRKLASWEHLYAEYQQKTTRLSKEHLEDFLFNKANSKINLLKYFRSLNNWYQRWEMLGFSDLKFRRIVRANLKRSIHVHVWNQASFDEFINLAIANLGLNLDIVETVRSASNKYEMIYLLKKTS